MLIVVPLSPEFRASGEQQQLMETRTHSGVCTACSMYRACVCVCVSEKRDELFPCVYLADVVLCSYMLRHQLFRETLPVVLKGTQSKSKASMSHLVLCCVQMSVLPIIFWYVWLKTPRLVCTPFECKRWCHPQSNHRSNMCYHQELPCSLRTAC